MFIFLWPDLKCDLRSDIFLKLLVIMQCTVTCSRKPGFFALSVLNFVHVGILDLDEGEMLEVELRI